MEKKIDMDNLFKTDVKPFKNHIESTAESILKDMYNVHSNYKKHSKYDLVVRPSDICFIYEYIHFLEEHIKSLETIPQPKETKHKQHKEPKEYTDNSKITVRIKEGAFGDIDQYVTIDNPSYHDMGE